MALPPHILASAETPYDLVAAVARGSSAVRDDHGMVSLPAIAPGASAPGTASTLNDVLNWHVKTTPDRTHIRILDEAAGPADLTYAALHREAVGVAAALITHDVMPGDRVAIRLPTCRSYFVTFAGAVLAGAVPVPVYPPARPSQSADHLRRTTGIRTNAGATMLVTVPEAVALGHLLRANVESPASRRRPRIPHGRHRRDTALPSRTATS
ncbi:MAG: AMP-binding protein [Mycobacterium sp.]|uniref:AMP-binding protein n=1 Tax=Mycobacterium sp. TaxID=1785 RepID=UPI003F9A3CA8